MTDAAGDDRSLVEAAQEGDTAAFAELVRRYERRVRGVVARILDDDRDVDEAVQDAFVQAWRSLDRFRGDAQVFTWLYRIAVNAALARGRRLTHPTVALDDLPREPASRQAEDAPEQAGVRERLLAAIRDLPPDYRAALVLRDVSGLSNDEVADVLELSLPAAKSRIHRARLQVRAALEGDA
jgi:RNA polymerase sigma-70 factor (ECF subfamily)